MSVYTNIWTFHPAQLFTVIATQLHILIHLQDHHWAEGEGGGEVLERANMHAKYKLDLFWGHFKNDKKKLYVSLLCQLIIIIYVKAFLK